MQQEMIIALQLQMTALVSLLAEKEIIDYDAFMELCRHTIAETQKVGQGIDWIAVRNLIEGKG